jgi:Ca2+-dependent lipid-binding protein
MKAHGDGWVVTVALIEGVDLASLESTGLSDPYVVFTCNGQTRSSSVKLETSDPQWNGLPSDLLLITKERKKQLF